MLSLPLPFTDARFDLALPFVFLPSFLRALVAFALLVGTAVVVAKLYRAELRRVSRRVAGVLLGLRVAAVAVVALLVAAAPVFVRVSKEAQRGRVVVAVDASDSMRIADPERPLLDKLRLARALRLHDGVATDEHLDAWIDDVARRGVPQFPPPDTDAGVARRGAFDEVIDRASTVTRGEVARRLAAELRPRLDALHAVESLEFGGASTDLKVPLTRAAEGRGEPLAGIVLLSDGRHNAGAPPLAPKDTPVFAVNVAPRDPPVDVAVESVLPAVTTVCRGSSVAVEVRVRATRVQAGPIDVSLKFANDRPPIVQTVNHAGGVRTFELTFHPRFDRLGPVTLTAEATTAPPDRLPANNTRAARLNVIDAKPRVLLIDGESRWEHHYLHAALSRSTDPPLDVKAVLFRQPRLGKSEESADLPLLKLPADLDTFECVVLGDATPEQLPRTDRERLRKYVADSGGTLVVVAGKRAMPLAFDDESFAPLLPIKHPRVVSPDDGFRPALTPDGLRSWFLRLGDTPEQSKAVWDGFPVHQWGVVGEAKESADVLAWVAEAKQKESARRSTLVARHHFGFGRVLFVGLDSTWRWRFKAGDEHHHRFWKQTVQWAVAGRLLPTATPDGTLRFGTRETVYRSNQDAEFTMRVSEKGPRPGENATVRLTRLPDTPAGTFPLVENDANPRELTARFRDLPPGTYAAEPDAPEWAEAMRTPAGKLRATFDVLPPESDEMSDLSGNAALLAELATSSGGRVFDAADALELVEELAARSTLREVEKPTPMRRSWWTLSLVVFLLTAEWVLRKWAGLA